MPRFRWIVLATLPVWFWPCHAQEFVDDALRPLFHGALLAQQVRGPCAEVDPALGDAIDAGLARLNDSHRANLAAGRAAAERRVGPQGMEHLAGTLARRFGERLQRQDTAGKRTECATLVTWLETSAARTRQALVEESFRKWLAQQQQARHIECAKLAGTARALSRRLLAALDAGEAGSQGPPDLLRADARTAEQAAAWCLQVQAAAAREGIRVPGDFARVRETARMIADAAMPQLSGRDPAAVVRRARERALRYLAERDWV
ncbi:hypothetical protein [Ramlibacter alkalitolerans]